MNNDKISKASNVRKPHPVYMLISEGLSSIDKLNYVKIYKERIMASNVLSDNGKKQPVVKIGGDNIVGVELLVDVPGKIVDFYAITSSEEGCGGKIVEAVVNAVPENWKIVVFMDWNHGFWESMVNKYPRIIVF